MVTGRLATIGLCLVLACSPAAGQDPDRIFLVHGNLIDGTGSPPVHDSVVEIGAGKIIAVGTADTMTVPLGSRTIDLRGRWLIPGLVDSHVHFFETGRLYTNPPAPDEAGHSGPHMLDYRDEVSYEEEARWARARIPTTLTSYLCAGVTSAISLGGPPFETEVKTSSANIGGPNIFTAGEAITTLAPDRVLNPFLDGRSTGQATTIEDGRALVRRFAAAGADAIKTGRLGMDGETDPGEMLEGVISEARARGLRVYHHEFDLQEAKRAIRTGVDALAHVVSSGPVDAEFLELAREKGVTVVTTAGLRDRTLEMLTGSWQLSPIEKRCADPEVIVSWGRARKDLSPSNIAQFRGVSAQWRENLRLMADADVPIAIGTDAGVAGTLHGTSMHREMLLMQDIGVTPARILVAATSAGAKALGRDEEIGSIRPGRRADIVVLSSDPLSDIRNASEIVAVIKNGRWHDQASLAAPQ